MNAQLVLPGRDLVGRAPEQTLIASLLDTVEERGAALVIRGAPGVGKSALLEWAATTAGDRFRVLRATGCVTEFGLPYAALHQLLGSMRPASLFGRTAADPPDLFSVAMAALELLAEMAAGQPVLVLADDAQWMDPDSQQILAFVARRIAADRIVLLATHRENEPGPLIDAAVPGLDVAPLGAGAAAALLDAVAAGLDPRTRIRLLNAARGNPLALLELSRGIDVGGEDLPLTARLERSFLARIDDFDQATRRFLDVAALNDTGDVAEILAAVALLTGPDQNPSMDPVVAAGLIVVDDAGLRFRHPLIRSALRQRLGPDRRRHCHAALAQVLFDQPERALWHAAAAALRPDAALAARLDRHAQQAIDRGVPANALRALERAAQLSTDLGDRRERTYRAAVLAYAAGQPETGQRLRTRFRDLADSGYDRLRHEWLNELAGADHGGEQRIHLLVELAGQAVTSGDGELATDFLRAAALRCWNLLPGRPVGREVIAAADRLGVADVTTRAGLLAYGSPFDSDGPVRALIARVPAAARDSATTYRLAHAAACAGAFDVSGGLLTEAAERLREEGRLHPLGRTLSLLTWTAMRRGNWSQSVAAAEESARLCAETRQPFWEAAALAGHATVAAFRGDFATAEQLIAAAGRPGARRAATIDAVLLVARAAVAAGRGNHDEAFTCLARLHDPVESGYHPVHALWSLAGLAEAAVACGEAGAARRLVAGLPAEVRDTTSPTGRMNLAMAGAILDTGDFAGALALDMTVWPYERYRLLFAYGKALRRGRRVRESRDYLREARDGFDRLGARPFAERAREELRAAGERSDSRPTDTWESLSPQEIQIATMVARGLSNRDIAKSLFISHRTVGSHLYRMFPKLGVTSRGELHAMAVRQQRR